MQAQRVRFGVGELLLTLALLLVANSAYLAAFGDPTLFYVANALLHPILGIAAAVLLVIYLIRKRTYFRSRVATVSLVLLALAVAFGIYLGIVGMTRPHSWALYVH